MSKIDINRYAGDIASTLHSIETGFFDALFEEMREDLANEMLSTSSPEEREALFQQATNIIALKSKFVTVITEYKQRKL